MSDYYETLGVSRDATADQIKKAFRERALESHPDRNPDNPAAEEKFKKINEAYSTLSDPDKKTRYDLGGYTADDFRSSRAGGTDPYGNPYENPYGQYSWTYTMNTGRRQEEPLSRREAVEMLLRSVLSFVVGIMLFRLATVFGIFGILICISVIGRGFMNSLRAIALLLNLKK